MQTNPQIQTRREFLGGLMPGWLRWKTVKAIVYAAAMVGLIYIGISTVRELGFADAIKTAAGFFTLLALAYLGGRFSDVAQGVFKRSPRVAQALICAAGRFFTYIIVGLCGIHIYERWKANENVGEVIIPLLLFLALQFRNELEKQRNPTTQQT